MRVLLRKADFVTERYFLVYTAFLQMSGMCRPPESIEKIEIVMRGIEETDNI